MSVLIKNMTFPDMCACCDFCGGLIFPGGIYTCGCPVDGIHGANITQYIEDDCRHPDCPLVDVPTPHGRLVDVDAFKADYGMKDDCADCEKEIHGKVKSCEYDRTYSKMDFCSWIGDADVVIEAEEKDED